MNKYTRIRDFHATRATGVGSSDIPILAGMYRRRGSTTLSLWESKTGRTPPWDGNERTRVGHDLEAYVLMRFIEERYGPETAERFYFNKLRDRSSGPLKAMTEARHPERSYCIAHCDMLADIDNGVDEPYIVEAKTVGMMAGKRREGEIFTGYDLEDRSAQGIPDAVYLQVQWQLFCYGVSTGWVAALIDNQYGTWGPIAADRKVQEKCLALAERFWRLVETDTPPPPETWDDVQRLFPYQQDTTAMISGPEEDHVREMVKRDKELAAHIKRLDDEREDIKNAVGILIGGNSVLASAEGDVLAKSSSQSRESVSVSKLKKEAPEIEAQLRAAGLVSVSSFRTVRY